MSQKTKLDGYIEEIGLFKKLTSLEVDSFFIVEGIPDIQDGKYGMQAGIPSNLGIIQTNNKKTIGSLLSQKDGSLGQKIARALASGKGYKVFVREIDANTGRKQKVISPF